MSIKLHNFTIGRVVYWKDINDSQCVGHVTGFGQTCHKETLIRVQPSDIYVGEPVYDSVKSPEVLLRPESLLLE